MGETDQPRKIENLKSQSFKQLSETENTSNTATKDTQGPTKQYWAIYPPPFTGTAWFIIWPLIKFSGRSVAEYLDNANANEDCPTPPWQRLPAHSFPITARVSFFLMTTHLKMISFTKHMTLSQNLALTYFHPHIPPSHPKCSPICAPLTNQSASDCFAPAHPP